jgi:hypothetical protein
MIGSDDDRIAAVQFQRDLPVTSFTRGLHLDRSKGSAFNFNVELFDRGDEDVAAVRLPPQYGREQAHHRRAGDGRTLMIPGAVSGDPHLTVAAALRIPLIDRGQAALIDHRLQFA